MVKPSTNTQNNSFEEIYKSFFESVAKQPPTHRERANTAKKRVAKHNKKRISKK